MRARTAACAALLIAATATACSSGSTDQKAATKPAVKASSTPTAAASAKTAGSPLRLGAGHHWSDTDLDGSHISGTTTVLSYSQPAPGVHLEQALSDFPHPEWAIIEVKVCADRTSSNVQVSQTPWKLGFPDDTQLQVPGISGAGIPKPEYPIEGTLVQPGRCLRGKITLSVEKGTRPNEIIYAVQGRDPIIWTVPKA
ncbi:hypothetical protein L0F81_00225 [Streptomyces tricolor]|uniref:Lipoprotein n=1 Tax=Streptomyces tricolor TaxID=68277 RepID=A0ABS9J835_9ACTN|nr:hypothetical protein [Streptomyces tricolor]MCG0061725.1 hypothetical protein [Streptomyces tricolor]